MSKIVTTLIMWLAWFSSALLAFLMAPYLNDNLSTLNSLSGPFAVFAAGIFLTAVLISGGLRFWLWRIRNPRLALLPFLVGVFFAWQAGLYGIFLLTVGVQSPTPSQIADELPAFCIVFQILSAILFATYLPLFVPLNDSSSPLPTTTNA